MQRADGPNPPSAMHPCPPAPRAHLHPVYPAPPSPQHTPEPPTHSRLALVYGWTCGAQGICFPGPSHGGVGLGGGVGCEGKGRAETDQRSCSPIGNALISVTATRPIQLKIITNAFQVFILAKRADCRLNRAMLFVKRGLVFTADTPPYPKV